MKASTVSGQPLLKTLSAALLLSGFAASQQFTAVVVESNRDDPKTLYPFDLDGDGDLDLVSGSDGDGKIRWAENIDGDANLWSNHTITDNAGGVHSVFVADMDGDADGDVLVTTKDDDTIAWYENDLGTGSVWIRHVVTTNVDYPKHAIAADLDGDGDLDVVSASVFDDKIAWFDNVSGNGLVWTEQVISTLSDAPTRVTVGDLDGDGDLDVSTASNIDTTILWFENSSGDGSTWIGHCVTENSFYARRVVAADIDGDGDVDLVASSTFASTMIWYENFDGLGLIWIGHLVSGAVDAVKDIHVGDIDGDGDLDLLSASLNGNKISWHENTDGVGTIWVQHDTGVLIDAPSAVFAADADGDGDTDIFHSSTGNDEIGCLLNDLGLRRKSPQLVLPPPPPG